MYKTLNNGIDIPINGFGVHKIVEGDDTKIAVMEAIKAGYRHIDIAQAYKNNIGVGQGIAQSIADGLVKREDLFIAGKIAHWNYGYTKLLKSFEEDLRILQLDYMDLCVLHVPVLGDWNDVEEIIVESYRALETLHKEGKIRSIGVSNFPTSRLERLLKRVKIKPVVNQIKINPICYDKYTIAYCQDIGIDLVGYETLDKGNALQIKEIMNIATKYNKTPAQICIKWSIQRGFIPLATSKKPDRIKQNYDIWDFELSREDMEVINSLWSKGLDKDYVNIYSPLTFPKKDIPYKTVYYLFNLIPFLVKVVARGGYNYKYKLFGFIPLFKVRRK